MALSRDRKKELIDDVTTLLDSSKLSVVAKYQGTTVKDIQALRKLGEQNGTKIRIVKNRLVKKALESSKTFKDADTSALEGMLLYAFNSEDEVASAQTLHNFAKQAPQITFVGAFTAEGEFIAGEDVQALAVLPSKEQLRAQLVGTIAAPLTGFVNVVQGNLRGVLNVLEAHAVALDN